jgi:hypothetical protein
VRQDAPNPDEATWVHAGQWSGKSKLPPLPLGQRCFVLLLAIKFLLSSHVSDEGRYGATRVCAPALLQRLGTRHLQLDQDKRKRQKRIYTCEIVATALNSFILVGSWNETSLSNNRFPPCTAAERVLRHGRF